VSTGARVYEINSPRDWWNLAASHPADAPGYRYTPNQDRSPSLARIDPDWSKVAQDWDAVHLSVGGMLTAEDVAFNRDGVRAELRDWDLESTCLLRWVFTSVERLDVHR
jgi:hypothetical protein